MDTKNVTYSDADNPFAGIGNQPALLSLDGTDHELGLYTTHSAKTPSKLINLIDFGSMVLEPTSKAKNRLRLITPHSATGKTAEAAEHAKYGAAIIDADGTEKSIEDTLFALTIEYGYQGALFHFTTSSHGSTVDKNGKPKHPNNYKIVIPLDREVDGETYHIVTTGLNLMLGFDAAQGRRYQGFYEPNSNTEGLPYHGDAIGLGGGFLTPQCELYKAAVARYEQYEAERQAKAEAAPLKPRLSLSGGDGGIVELINSAYTVEGLLEAYGHKQRGKKWLSPHSSTKMAGGVILSNGRFYSHHGADCPLSSDNHDGHSLDAAAMLCALKYNNDFAAMITAEANNLDADGQKARQREHMAELERQRDAKLPVDFEVVEQDLKVPEQPRNKRNQERIYNIIKDTAIGRRAKDLALTVEMPTDTVCLAGLGVVSGMVAGARAVERRGYGRVPTGLYIAVEQPPSTGKSYAINGFRDPLLKQLKKANKAFIEKTQEMAKDAGEDEPKFVPCLDLFQSNATPEAMEQIAENNKGLFSVVGDEQAAIDTLLGLTYGEGNNNNGLVLNGFAGEYFSSARVTRKGFKGYVFGGVTVMAQEGTARKIVQGSQGQGVVERFLLWNEPNLLGDRLLEYHEMTTTLEYEQMASNLVRLAVAQYSKEDSGLDTLPTLKITSEGWAAIKALRLEVEPLLADDGKYSHPLLRGAAGKVDMQVMKIAATLHMTDECLELVTPDTLYWEPHYIIHDKYVTMAIEVVKVTLEQLIHTLEANGIIGRDSYMDALAEYLESKHKPITARAIAQSLKNRTIFKSTGKPTQYINEALQRLVDIEVVTATQETIGGKPQTVYKMH
ncbi:DUF3987 domain-containing protein [Orrella sp. 11846]|uniref:DUF3987 domain-containing protein n=1 Tax=Orrella sp. 11846 TaxID=3409913 RepID=UPI003B5BA7FD